jgi:hypothetical protein
MFPFSRLFAKYFSRLPGFPIGRRQPTCRRKKATRLMIEALEERQVPTVLFQPQFGADVSSGAGPHEQILGAWSSMYSPNVYPIFWGVFGKSTRTW